MLWLPFLCSCTSESSPCLPSAYTHSRCWCLSGMLSMKPKWFAESRLHESTSFVLTSSKISHLFSVFSPHVSPIVMLHHIDKLAWFATKLIFHRQPGQGGAFKYFKYSKFPPSHSGWEWYQLGTRRRVCKLLQGRQGRSSFEQGGKGFVRRGDLGTHCSGVCILKWKDWRNHSSKIWTWTRVHLHQGLSLGQEPTSKANLPAVTTSCAFSSFVEWIWKRGTQHLPGETHTYLWKPTADKHRFSLCHAPGSTLFPCCGCWRAWKLG